MICKNCGNIVIKTESRCRSCGAAILPDEIQKSLDRQSSFEFPVESIGEYSNAVQTKKFYRSRWALLFVYWIGGAFGLHYVWMGDAEAAKNTFEKVIKDFLGCFILVGIIPFTIDVMKYLIEFFAIIFGKFKTDAQGNPIVWFKSGKPEL